MITETNSRNLKISEKVSNDITALDIADDFQVAGWQHWDYKKFSNWTWDNDGQFNLNDPKCIREQSMEACLNRTSIKEYVRVYPMAVSGRLVGVGFNKSEDLSSHLGDGRASVTGNMHGGSTFGPVGVVKFIPNLTEDSVDQEVSPTVIFVPEEWHYENGFEVDVTGTEPEFNGLNVTCVRVAPSYLEVRVTRKSQIQAQNVSSLGSGLSSLENGSAPIITITIRPKAGVNVSADDVESGLSPAYLETASDHVSSGGVEEIMYI